MMDYTELVKALRYCAESGDFKCGKDCPMHTEYPNCLTKMDTDAAAAIEELQQIADHHEQTAKDYWKEACEYKAQLPKRGEWVLQASGQDCKCSVCESYWIPFGDEYDYKFCPNCGAKMNDSNASNAQDGPIITPCRGCSDYDGYGGCKSKGGCARKLRRCRMGELIDREALLDECLNHYEVGNIEQNCTMDWICKTVRNFPAASPWHRVEEPPKDKQECFVAFKGPLGFVYDTGIFYDELNSGLDEDIFEDGTSGFVLGGEVGYALGSFDYWMPIEPPKEDA